VTVQLPFDQPHPLRMAPVLCRMQREGVIHRVRTAVGDQAWLVTGYEEVRRLLADDRLGRSHPEPAKAARMGDSALFGGPMATTVPSTPTVPACGPSCSRTSRRSGCVPSSRGWSS
jgi:cytochrome P450